MAHTDPTVPVLLALAVLFMLAKLGGLVAAKLGQPAVLGELIAGMGLGNLPAIGVHAFDFIGTNETFAVMAGLGVVLLLFEVGLESSVAELLKAGPAAGLVAVTGVIAPLALGYGVGVWLLPERSWYVHLFLGAALCATSVGITARVLKDLGCLATREARIILGAAVLDDVLALLVLAVVQGMIAAANATAADQATGAGVSVLAISLIVAKAVGFLAAALLLGTRLAPALFRHAARLRSEGLLLTLALILCFILAWAADRVGLAPIVGAFAAGLIVSGAGVDRYTGADEPSLEALLHPVSRFFVPLFFVLMGAKVQLATLTSPGVAWTAAVLAVAAFVSKQVCGLAAPGRGLNRLAIGFGMVPRGEVGLIFAAIGATLLLGGQPLVDKELYASIVLMVMATTVVTPITLKWSLQRKGG